MSGVVGFLKNWRRLLTIRTKIMVLALGLVLVMGLGAALVARAAFVRSMTAELERRGGMIAGDVATLGADLLLTQSVVELHELVAATAAYNDDVRYVAVLDLTGRPQAHSFGTHFPAGLLSLPKPGPDTPSLTSRLETEEGLLLDVAVPVLDGLAGTVRVGMSPERLQTEAIRLAQGIALTMLFVAGLALALAYWLTLVLTRPIRGLVLVATAAGAGDMSQRVSVIPSGEVGLLVSSFHQMLERLASAQQVKQAVLRRVLSLQEEERRRLARDLHEETSQAVAALSVGLTTLGATCPGAREQTEELRRQALQMLADMQEAVRDLRPRVLDELGLIPAVRRLVEDLGRTHGVETQLESAGQSRFSAAVENCLYRVVQEALTNVVRHSQATNVAVVITSRSGGVTVVVEDNGIGFDPDADHGVDALGIAGMRERAAILGGRLEIESSASGTTVIIRIPLQ